jgi:hypothetical protein
MSERSAWSRLVEWVLPDTQPDFDEIDTGYLLSGEVNLKYIDIANDTPHGTARCNLCGRLYHIEQMPEAVEHVASHNDQGEAEIDPFEAASAEYVMSFDESDDDAPDTPEHFSLEEGQ